MRAGFSFSYPPISLLLGQPLSIKKSYAGAIQLVYTIIFCASLKEKNPGFFHLMKSKV
jgi:hypothetical protein